MADLDPHETPKSLLVIDDEKGLRDMLSHALSRRGWKVKTAESGETGVAAARAEDFDVILSDIMMPGMDGLAVLEILKRELPTTEVLLVTGYPTAESSERAAALGAFSYLAKPYDLMALCALLEEAVAAKRRRVRA